MTENTQPVLQPGQDPKAAAAAAKAYAKASRPWFKKKRYIGLIALVAIFAIAAGSGGGSSTDDRPKTAAERAAEDRAERSSAPDPAEPAAEEPAQPDMTAGQENAVAQAENYLEHSAFSRKGLIDQLKFEGYSEADATFAVDYLRIDFKQQAALQAEKYLEQSAFSREGLIEQLMFEGYSRENAEYGATAAGL